MNAPQQNLLIVDDEIPVLIFLEELAKRMGLSPTTATNGAEALERLKEGGFNLMLSDVNMPGIDGVTLLERVKHLRPEIEVIMITGFGSIDIAVACMEKGAYAFIKKPFNLETLKTKIMAGLDQSGRNRDQELETRLRDHDRRKQLRDDLANKIGGALSHNLRQPLTVALADLAIQLKLGRMAESYVELLHEITARHAPDETAELDDSFFGRIPYRTFPELRAASAECVASAQSALSRLDQIIEQVGSIAHVREEQYIDTRILDLKASRRRSVLLLSASEPLHASLADGFDRERIALTVARDPAQADEFLEDQRFDAAVVDLSLAETDPEALEVFLHQRLGAIYRVPTVLLGDGQGARADPDLLERAERYYDLSTPRMSSKVVGAVESIIAERSPSEAIPAR